MQVMKVVGKQDKPEKEKQGTKKQIHVECKRGAALVKSSVHRLDGVLLGYGNTVIKI